MTTTPRRLSSSSLFFGLAVSLGLVSSPAWAAPPDGDTPALEAAPGEDATSDNPAETGTSEELAADSASDDAPPPEEEVPAQDPPSEVEGPVGSEAEAKPDPDPVPPPAGKPAPATAGIGDKHSITYTNLLAPRVNPLGLENRLWIGYQYRLYDKNKTILNGSNIGIFFRPIVSPAIALIGATLQLQPAAVLRLRATYSFVQWFGTFQYMQSYKSPNDDYSETRLGAQTDFQESNYTTNGHQVELEALVQARYKGLVIRSATFGIYNNYDLRGDDDVFYSVRYDIMAPGQGWMLSNDTDLLWLQAMKGPRKATLMAGARASTLMPFFKDEVYEEGDDAENNPIGPQFRVGPALGYIFYDRPDRHPRFNRPTLLLMPQWSIKHRWRTGRDVKTAFPTIVIAFVFTGQLWGKN